LALFRQFFFQIIGKKGLKVEENFNLEEIEEKSVFSLPKAAFFANF